MFKHLENSSIKNTQRCAQEKKDCFTKNLLIINNSFCWPRVITTSAVGYVTIVRFSSERTQSKKLGPCDIPTRETLKDATSTNTKNWWGSTVKVLKRKIYKQGGRKQCSSCAATICFDSYCEDPV